MDLKVLIAICTIIMIYVDDVLPQDPSMLYEFQNNLINRRPQGHPLLDCLVEQLMPRMWDYYEPLVANAITVGFYEFIIGTAMEGLTKTMIHHPSAPRFPEYVRFKSGAPAQYGYWMFPRDKYPDVSAYIQAVPDLLSVINRMNDILSFYKEELAGENDNFVHMRAKVAGKDVISTLDDTCEETMLGIRNISATLASDAAAHKAFHVWLAGYIYHHLCTSRYRLKELF
jgi:hypothetical protein